jgi:hypothetical protein
MRWGFEMASSEAPLLDRWARIWFGATALLTLGGLILAGTLAYRDPHGVFRRGWPNALNELAYFTEQSHLLIGTACLLLAIRLDRSSTVFRVLRLTGLVAIIVTGVVYHVLLSADAPTSGWARIENVDLHTVAPIAAVLGFLLFGPRGLIAPRFVGLTLIFLVGWAIFTTVRGAIIGWYPYGFIDANAKGYPRVTLNALGLALAYVAIGLLCLAVDRGLARRQS